MAEDWRKQAERSSPFMLRIIVYLALHMPRALVRLILYPTVGYFMLSGGTSRTASLQYLRRVLRRAPVWRDVWRHFFAFASCTLDRILVLAGRTALLQIEIHRPPEVTALVARQPGCILLVAHFGMTEAMRVIGATKRQLPLSILLDREHGRMLTELLERLNPQLAAHVIDASERGPQLALRLKEALEAGRMVCLMADRVTEGEGFAVADFLGAPARFAESPWLLAHALRVPVILGFGVYCGGNRYATHFEIFAEQVALPRQGRHKALAEYAQRYAARLEHYVHEAPYNWFNFYDYWLSAAPHAEPSAKSDEAATD